MKRKFRMAGVGLLGKSVEQATVAEEVRNIEAAVEVSDTVAEPVVVPDIALAADCDSQAWHSETQ